MNTSAIFPYRFCNSEPGVFAEIYLPKKMSYQGVLYASLKEGFDFEAVKLHLKTDDSKIRTQIREHLKNYNELSDYENTRIDDMEQVFDGYSMYEVDGVFFDINKNLITEERTQVIRIMLIPKLELLCKKLGINQELDKDEFWYLRGLVYRALEDKSVIARYFQHGSENEKEIVRYISKWIEDTALFIFGFIMFKICTLIKGEIKPEEVIWVTSFWGMNLNRIIREKGEEE